MELRSTHSIAEMARYNLQDEIARCKSLHKKFNEYYLEKELTQQDSEDMENEGNKDDQDEEEEDGGEEADGGDSNEDNTTSKEAESSR